MNPDAAPKRTQTKMSTMTQIYASELILSFTFSADLDTFCQESTSHSKIWWDHCGGLGNHLSWLQLQARVLQRLPRLHIRFALSQFQDPLLVRQDDADAGLVAQSLPATAKAQQGLRKIFTGTFEITCLGSSSKLESSSTFLACTSGLLFRVPRSFSCPPR